MSHILEGVIQSIQVKGPFPGKNGKPDFDRHELQINGLKLTRFTDVGKDVEVNEGDNVKILYNSTVNGKFTNNTVTKITKLGAGNATPFDTELNLPITTKANTGNAAKTATATKEHTVQGPKLFDNKGARVGGVLHDAVSLAIHQGETLGVAASTKDVEELAEQLLEIAARLEK